MDTATSPSPLRWHVGPIGFAYPEWRGNFYPRELAEADRLTFLTGACNAVEINTTFYAVPSDEVVRRWIDATPEAFTFSLKMPRDVTHGPTPTGSVAAHTPPAGHLTRPETRALAADFINVLAPLGPRLGALLLQFPPGFAPAQQDELLAFLDAALPLSGRPAGAAIAIELRHSGWFEPARRDPLVAAFSARGLTWTAADEAPVSQVARPPAPRGGPTLIATSTALYLRLLGKHRQFADLTHEQADPAARLAWWLERINETARQNAAIRDVFVFVNNDYTGHSPTTVQHLTTTLSLPAAGPGVRIVREPTLFD